MDLLCVGIDPGIVHTGVVSLGVAPGSHTLYVDHRAVVGADPVLVDSFIGAQTRRMKARPKVFIEGYKPRSHLQHDREMVEAVANLRTMTQGKVLDNMGIKKIVKPKLLELLGIGKFKTPTHHQDLLSAARILVLGMLKDDDLNEVLSGIVINHLDGQTWRVIDCS